MPNPCHFCTGDEESDDVTVYGCCFGDDERCWDEVCDECAFRTNKPEYHWKGGRVCPPCWESHVNANNQTSGQKERNGESQCSECDGIGEVFVEKDKFDSEGRAPGLPADEIRYGYQTCWRCDGTGFVDEL